MPFFHLFYWIPPTLWLLSTPIPYNHSNWLLLITWVDGASCYSSYVSSRLQLSLPAQLDLPPNLARHTPFQTFQTVQQHSAAIGLRAPRTNACQSSRLNRAPRSSNGHPEQDV